MTEGNSFTMIRYVRASLEHVFDTFALPFSVSYSKASSFVTLFLLYFAVSLQTKRNISLQRKRTPDISIEMSMVYSRIKQAFSISTVVCLAFNEYEIVG